MMQHFFFLFSYRIGKPAIGNERPLLLHTHHFPHVLEAGIVGHLIVKGRPVLLNDTCRAKARKITKPLAVCTEVVTKASHRRWAAHMALTVAVRAPRYLPQHQSKGPYVNPLVGVEAVGLNGFVQHFRCHVAFGANLRIVAHIQQVVGLGVGHSQPCGAASRNRIIAQNSRKKSLKAVKHTVYTRWNL